LYSPVALHAKHDRCRSGVLDSKTVELLGATMNFAKLLRATGVATASLFVATASQAASLTVTAGEVLVSHGAGYQRVTGSVELAKGDSVVAKPRAIASVAYGDGCAVSLKEQAVFIIGDLSPCTLHSAGRGASGATVDPGGGAAAVAGGEAAASVLPYVIGAAVVGGVVAAVASSSGNDDTPTTGAGGNGGGDGGGPGASP
jgi:hypothetical protein